MATPELNTQIVQAVEFTNQAVLRPQKASNASEDLKPNPLGGAIAYQLVAESGALAIQDAVDHLRNITQVATAGLAVIMAKIAKTPIEAPLYAPAIEELQKMITDAATNLATVGTEVGKAMDSYPTDKS